MVAVGRLLVVLGLGACLRSTQFECQTDDQCAGGICQPVGFCSFADASCPDTMQRFGEVAGSLSNTCVGVESTTDAGIDAPIDVPAIACPSDYVALAGTPTNHKYKAVTAANTTWNEAQTLCAASQPGAAYLAIPDDAAELTAHATLVGGRHWVGITDQQTENTFVTVNGMPQTFLPWEPGEPDNDGDQDCVAANAMDIQTDRCSLTRPYLCECEE